MSSFWSRDQVKLLGTQPDGVNAKTLGRTVDAVRQQRLMRDIPRVPVPGEAKPWTRKEHWLLGTKPDAEIGRLLGRTAQAVQTRRLYSHAPESDSARFLRRIPPRWQVSIGRLDGSNSGAQDDYAGGSERS